MIFRADTPEPPMRNNGTRHSAYTKKQSPCARSSVPSAAASSFSAFSLCFISRCLPCVWRRKPLIYLFGKVFAFAFVLLANPLGWIGLLSFRRHGFDPRFENLLKISCRHGLCYIGPFYFYNGLKTYRYGGGSDRRFWPLRVGEVTVEIVRGWGK